MGLSRVHRARREVTFVSHKDHGNIIGILNTFNLFSAKQENWKFCLFISFPYYYFCSLMHPSTLFSHSYMSVGWDPPSIINCSTPGEPTTRGTLGPRGRASAYRCWAVLHCWRREGGWTTGRRQTALPHHYSSKCQMPCSQGGLSERRGSDHSISPAFLLNQPQYSLQYSQPNPSAVSTAIGNYDHTCSEFWCQSKQVTLLNHRYL